MLTPHYHTLGTIYARLRAYKKTKTSSDSPTKPGSCLVLMGHFFKAADTQSNSLGGSRKEVSFGGSFKVCWTAMCVNHVQVIN